MLLQEVTQKIRNASVHDIDKNTSCSSCSNSGFFCSSNCGIKNTNRLVWSDGGTIMGGLHVALMTDWECRGLSQAANWEDLNECMAGETSKLFITAAKTGFLNKYSSECVNMSYCSGSAAAASLQTLSICAALKAHWGSTLSTFNCSTDHFLS